MTKLLIFFIVETKLDIVFIILIVSFFIENLNY